MKVQCPHCNGTGLVEHECNEHQLLLVETIYSHGTPGQSSESSIVKVCPVCKVLWFIRYQYDAGTGSDDYWWKEGSKEFPKEEAKKYREKAIKIMEEKKQ